MLNLAREGEYLIADSDLNASAECSCAQKYFYFRDDISFKNVSILLDFKKIEAYWNVCTNSALPAGIVVGISLSLSLSSRVTHSYCRREDGSTLTLCTILRKLCYTSNWRFTCNLHGQLWIYPPLPPVRHKGWQTAHLSYATCTAHA